MMCVISLIVFTDNFTRSIWSTLALFSGLVTSLHICHGFTIWNYSFHFTQDIILIGERESFLIPLGITTKFLFVKFLFFILFHRMRFDLLVWMTTWSENSSWFHWGCPQQKTLLQPVPESFWTRSGECWVSILSSRTWE